MKRIYLMLLLAVAAVACQEEILQPELPVSDGQMRFNLTAPGVQTKASGDAFVASDRIGIYVTDYQGQTPMPLQVSGNRANNMSMTYNGTVWTPRKPVYWGEGKADVYAYYPYIESITDVNAQSFTLALDQNSRRDGETLGGYEASDLLWAKATGVSKEDGTVNLAMKHILSKLTVKIVAGEDYVGSLPEDASVLIHSTVPSVKVDFETGAVVKDSYSGAQSIEMKKLGLRTSNGVEAVVYEAVVVPQMLETTVPLLEINSKSVSYLVEDSFNFRPGIAYTYTVTLNTSTNAIKVDIGCELEDWNSTGDGDSGEDGEEGGDDEGEDDGREYTNLSTDGTANCYIVSEAGSYKFKAVQGNLDATVGNVKTVEVLWESFGTDVAPNVGDLVADASYKDGYIRFSTSDVFKEGNAVIAAKNSAGTILWSWHLWFTDQPEIHFYSKEAGFMMDRNLGATSAEPGEVGALGLLYQHGRKDPFLGSSSISKSVDAASTGNWSNVEFSDNSANGTIDLMEKNPTTFYFNSYYSDSWVEHLWQAEKTSADPCPVGWRVPEGGDNGFWHKAGLYNEGQRVDDVRCGVLVDLPYQGYAWYPHVGRRNTNFELCDVGRVAFHRSTKTSGVIYLARKLYYESHHRADAISVRCCRDYDETLMPDISQPSVDIASAVDLSVEGTANCYVVSEAGVYSFPAVKGNSMESVGAADYTSVVWESFGTEQPISSGDLIEASRYENGKVYFKTAGNFKEGNALIAVKDENGKILWSWHIWMTDEPKGQEYYNDAGVMLDRNLGATSAIVGEPGLLGLVYQWGRKDPFIANLRSQGGDVYIQSTYFWDNNLSVFCDNPQEYAVAHPTLRMTDLGRGDWYLSESYADVDDTRWQSDKTVYDPCPAGWRVPDGGNDSVLLKARGGGYAYTSGNGYNFRGILGDHDILYPSSGYYYNSREYSYYWTNTPHQSKNERSDIDVVCAGGDPYNMELWFSINDYYSNRVELNLVRCQKE